MLAKALDKPRSISEGEHAASLPKLDSLLRKTAQRRHAEPSFLLADPTSLHQLKKQLAKSRKNDPNLSDERELLSGWKSLFSKRLKRAAHIRKFDDYGCRPGFHCLKKRTDCQTKDFALVEPSPMLNVARLREANQQSSEFTQRKDKLQTTVQLILMSYEYLKSLHYSDRKIGQIVKFHCRDNIDTRSVLLKSVDEQSPKRLARRFQYEANSNELMEKISAVLSSKKKGFEVEEFVFCLEEYQRKLEQDATQRGTDVVQIASIEMRKRMQTLRDIGGGKQLDRLYSLRHLNDGQKVGQFTERLAKIEGEYGGFERISKLSRNLYHVMQTEKENQRRHRALSLEINQCP